MGVYGELSFAELAMSPVFILLLAGGSLFLFNNSFKAISYLASNEFVKLTGGATKAVQPYIKQIKPFFEQIFGDKVFSAAGAFPKVELTHLLLAAILIVLIGMWRTNHINNQLLAAQAKVEEPAKANKKKAE